MPVRCSIGTAVRARAGALPGAGLAQATAGSGCFSLQGGDGGAPLHLKPTGERTFLLHARDGQLLGVRDGAVVRLGGPEAAGPAAEWTVGGAGPPHRTPPRLRPATGCTPFPRGRAGRHRDVAHAAPRCAGRRLGRHAPAPHRRPARRRARRPRAGLRPLRDRPRARRRRGRPRRRTAATTSPATCCATGCPSEATTRRAGRPSPAGRSTTRTPTSRSIGCGWSGRGRRAAARRRPGGRGRPALPDRAAAVALLRRDGDDRVAVQRLRALEALRRRAERRAGRGWLRIVDRPARRRGA